MLQQRVVLKSAIGEDNQFSGHSFPISKKCQQQQQQQQQQRHWAKALNSKKMPGTPRPPFPPKLTEQTGQRHTIDRNMSKSVVAPPQYEVFLGGSCNPTTWRQKVAIPMLRDRGISFYNPQVTHWEEALVEVEYRAKQSASVVFIVLDRNTRNVVSMIETAYMAGCRRKLVVVMDSYTGPGQLINGEPISELEYQDLTNGFNTVRDLVERQNIPVFSDLTHALNCTAKILRENIYPQDLGSVDNVKPSKYPRVQLDDKLIKLHEAFINSNPEQITLAEAKVVYKAVTNKELTSDELQAIVAAKKGVSIQDLNGTELPLSEVRLTFEEFCCVVAECKNSHIETKRLWDILSHSLQRRVIGWALPSRPHRQISTSGGGGVGSGGTVGSGRDSSSSVRDIYLGGTVGEEVKWRDEVAIPLVRRSGLTFSLPTTCSDVVAMDSARVLLFVVTDTTRSVSCMALASHYIGLGYNVVLCVQMLSETSLVDGEELSRQALKDYNRGRTYLIDQAKKDNVPVFTSIQEAVECAVSRALDR